MKCSYCGKTIPKRTRYYKGIRGGHYHIFCGSRADLKYKDIAWTK